MTNYCCYKTIDTFSVRIAYTLSIVFYALDKFNIRLKLKFWPKQLTTLKDQQVPLHGHEV